MSCTFVYGFLSWWNKSGGGNLLTYYGEPSMIHLAIKSYPMVNKKGVEVVHFVCLSCHFDMGLFHILGQEVPQLTLLMMLLLLTMIFNLNLLCFPSWVTPWCRYLYSRGMRHSTDTLLSTLLIFSFTLNFNHSRCYDRGNESLTPKITTLQSLT